MAMELALEATSGDESGVDLGRESDGSTGLELGDDAVAVGTSLGTASRLLATGSTDVDMWPEFGSDVAARPATPLRRKCPTASDANAAEVGDASNDHARGGSTGHLRLQ